MNRIKGLSILLFLIFQGMIVVAQVQDAGLWFSLNVEKRLNRSLSVCFSEEIRLNENMTEVGTIFSDIGLEYRFWKRFRVSGHYRFILKRMVDDTYDPCNRFYFDVSYREKFRSIHLILRQRFQSQYNDLFTDQSAMIPDYYSRTRLTVKLDLNKRFEPYLYAESFVQLNNREGILFDAMRYCGGVEYNLTRMHRIDLFYMIQQQYQVKNPDTDFIIGISYSFIF